MLNEKQPVHLKSIEVLNKSFGFDHLSGQRH